MKIALLMCLATDGRSGVPVSDLEPYDQALLRFKGVVATGVAPVADLPVLALWTTGGEAKRHKFKPATESEGGAGKVLDKGVRKKLGDGARLKALQGEVKEAMQLLSQAETERDTAKAYADDLKAKLEVAVLELQEIQAKGQTPGIVVPPAAAAALEGVDLTPGPITIAPPSMGPGGAPPTLNKGT